MFVVYVVQVFASLFLLVQSSWATEESNSLTATYDYGDFRVLDYKIKNVLQCNITGKSNPDLIVKWMKADLTIEPNDHYEISNNNLIIHRTSDDDMVTYSCLLSSKSNPTKFLMRRDFRTVGKPTAKIVSQGTFIEGQKLSLECVVSGHPTPTIKWKFGNQTITESTDRIKLLPNEKKIANALLQIDEAELTDRGTFNCTATNVASERLNLSVEASAYIRVKGKLAALWPFIGICAEVIVLCTIIFVYERKRNKAELEESDTDISPDQKYTPDHGKEPIRQRK